MTGVVAALACALAGSLVRARERRRDVLAARARHEVRGPLCAARLALDGLERCARVEAIDAELRRAALALDDLARDGRSPRRRRTPVDVGALLRESEPAWQAFAATRDTRLTLELPEAAVHLTADALRLSQACANLVSNAIEHGGDHVTVRVARVLEGGAHHAWPSLAADGRVRVEVLDSGPGLSAPLPVLLAAARGRSTVRGHGLAIAAAIAEREGGRLTGSGACLALELPGR